jgi:hypothetical protein
MAYHKQQNFEAPKAIQYDNRDNKNDFFSNLEDLYVAQQPQWVEQNSTENVLTTDEKRANLVEYFVGMQGTARGDGAWGWFGILFIVAIQLLVIWFIMSHIVRSALRKELQATKQNLMN